MTQTSLAPAPPTAENALLCASWGPTGFSYMLTDQANSSGDAPAQIPESHTVPWSRPEESSSLLSPRSLPSHPQLVEGSGSNLKVVSLSLEHTHVSIGLGWAQIQVLVMW